MFEFSSFTTFYFASHGNWSWKACCLPYEHNLLLLHYWQIQNIFSVIFSFTFLDGKITSEYISLLVSYLPWEEIWWEVWRVEWKTDSQIRKKNCLKAFPIYLLSSGNETTLVMVMNQEKLQQRFVWLKLVYAKKMCLVWCSVYPHQYG